MVTRKTMKINSIVILLTAASAQASTIVNLSNYQATVDQSVVADSGGGLAFSGATDLPSTYPGYPTTIPGAVMVLIDILGGGRIRNEAVAQYIHATASVDYTTPGYHLTRINVYGNVMDDGSGVGGNVWITSPCEAGVNQSCTLPLNAPESGTFTAFLNMRSDAWIIGLPHPSPDDTGFAGQLRLEMVLVPDTEPGTALVPTPEPGTMLLIGGALIGLGVIRRKRWISETSRACQSLVGF